jgi:hypothetical protein
MFTVGTLDGSNEGTKTLLYANNGMGKTTLAAMAPDPLFIPLDDGARLTTNPKTGEKLRGIQGHIEAFEDLRDVFHSTSLFPSGSTLVLDTVTKAEPLAVAYLLRTLKVGNALAENLEDYGYGKGYVHLTDTMRLLLTDLDPLVRKGVNIVLLAQQGQATVSNLEGIDYAQDGPQLTSQPKGGANVRAEVCGWVDNIFRIGYPEVSVVKANKQASRGKASGETTRQVYTEPAVWYVAKNRMNGQLPAVISFSSRDDDSLWRGLADPSIFKQEE